MTRWEELGMTAEEYVRKSWPEMSTYHRDLDSYGTDQFRIYLRQSSCKWPDDEGYLKMFQEDDNKKGRQVAWLAAATYTADHEEAIRQKREEIEFMVDGSYPAEAGKVRKRILAVLEGQLEGMLKGWKEN